MHIGQSKKDAATHLVSLYHEKQQFNQKSKKYSKNRGAGGPAELETTRMRQLVGTEEDLLL